MSPLFSVFVQDHQQKILVFERMLYLQSAIQAAERLFLTLFGASLIIRLTLELIVLTNESSLSRYE